MLQSKNVLLCTDPNVKIAKEFFGTVFCTDNLSGPILAGIDDFNKCKAPGLVIYMCGDIESLFSRANLTRAYMIYCIQELSTNYKQLKGLHMVTLGEVPTNVHNVGVYYRKLFNSDKNYYDRITQEHEFQDLKLGNKPGVAFRKGIYMTPVTKTDEGVYFNLLRCSTNLTGPTDNLRETDLEIIKKANELASYNFKDSAQLNHVLAQTYHNHIDEVDEATPEKTPKQRKSKIAEHSDKTKDMPKNGLLVFTTFYKDLDQLETKRDGFDYTFGKDVTVLTKLRFRLKADAVETNPKLTRQFDVTLYPNSMFMINLEINRLYTHEIIPSTLPVDKIPTRMGYVIRCSNTKAIFKEGQTHICSYGHQFPLEQPTKEGLAELKKLYYAENSTIETVDYNNGDFRPFRFSMNSNDYSEPIV